MKVDWHEQNFSFPQKKLIKTDIIFIKGDKKVSYVDSKYFLSFKEFIF